MGVVQLPDDLQREVERQVAEGHAQSPEAFVEEAVRRLIEDIGDGEGDLAAVVQQGIADIEAGRFVILESEEDWERLHADTMARIRARLGIGE